MAKTIALIVAAGSGSRVGGAVPKQYRKLCGKPLLRYCIEKCLSAPEIDDVRVVINPQHRDLYDSTVADLNLAPPIFGGLERQQSVCLGLEALSVDAPDHVLIHDAARPFIPSGLISGLVATLTDHKAVIPGLAVTDTIKRSDADRMVENTVTRKGLFAVQTPQTFHYSTIMAAHKKAEGQVLTDDGAVAEAAGIPVKVIDGDENLFKVTREEDFLRAETLLAHRYTTRTGSGFDVHRFETGDHVTLCGIEIPHSHGLKGHSDADVALHAVTDALYGAVGGGDIGQHFPPSDPQWRGAASDLFLHHAGEMISSRDGEILNIDLTIICEAPKIGPHRGRMAARIAEILGLAKSLVNVKATTTEGLGFTGRGEGIAAQAIASVKLPRDEKGQE